MAWHMYNYMYDTYVCIDVYYTGVYIYMIQTRDPEDSVPSVWSLQSLSLWIVPLRVFPGISQVEKLREVALNLYRCTVTSARDCVIWSATW